MNRLDDRSPPSATILPNQVDEQLQSSRHPPLEPVTKNFKKKKKRRADESNAGDDDGPHPQIDAILSKVQQEYVKAYRMRREQKRQRAQDGVANGPIKDIDLTPFELLEFEEVAVQRHKRWANWWKWH